MKYKMRIMKYTIFGLLFILIGFICSCADDKGNYKPDILVDDKTFQAQQRRSQIVGNNINQPDGAKLSMAALMKLKNQNPDMDITPYLNRKEEK